MDAAGRIVVPSDIRREAGLVPGEILDVTVRDGTVEIRPACLPVSVVKRGALHVAVPDIPVDALDQSTVASTLTRLRARHTKSQADAR